jgi:low affinity Fe/Cu permease
MKTRSISELFGRFATRISTWAGHPATFTVAVLCLFAWAACGHSTGWQLVVNTCTTICTFLMVFIIQNSQNRDGLAAQIKLEGDHSGHERRP